MDYTFVRYADGHIVGRHRYVMDLVRQSHHIALTSLHGDHLPTYVQRIEMNQVGRVKHLRLYFYQATMCQGEVLPAPGISYKQLAFEKNRALHSYIEAYLARFSSPADKVLVFCPTKKKIELLGEFLDYPVYYTDLPDKEEVLSTYLTDKKTS